MTDNPAPRWAARFEVLVLLSACILSTGLSTTVARAATLRRVTPTGSNVGDCSVSPCRTISYAIGQSVDGDQISVASGTYAEHVVVDRSVTIVGDRTPKTIIDGSDSGTVISVGAPGASVVTTISMVTIRHGQSPTGGGVNSTPGTGQTNQVTLRNTRIRANEATGISNVAGGGIYNEAGSAMRVVRSSVLGNLADGGIRTPASGGGIYNGGTVFVSHSTLAGNRAIGGWGGIVHPIGVCRGAPTGAPGAGGGVFDASSNPTSATLVNTTLSGNEAVGGAAGMCVGPRAGRGAGGSGRGGGISGGVRLLNATIAGNHATPGYPSTTNAFGGGIESPSGAAESTNSIVAMNTAVTGPDCFGKVVSAGANLLGDDAGCGGFTSPGDLLNSDPMLGPLANNGGPTRTMGIAASSPAVDAASDPVCAALPVNGVDQRNLPRPGGPHCDIGAFELQS